MITKIEGNVVVILVIMDSIYRDVICNLFVFRMFCRFWEVKNDLFCANSIKLTSFFLFVISKYCLHFISGMTFNANILNISKNCK